MINIEVPHEITSLEIVMNEVGVSMRDLSAMSRCSIGCIRNYLLMAKEPTSEIAYCISKALGRPLEEVFRTWKEEAEAEEQNDND